MEAKDFPIQFDELSEETSIRNHTPVVFHSTNSLHKCQLVLQHQIGQDQGGRTAHSYMTMHQDFAWEGERLHQGNAKLVVPYTFSVPRHSELCLFTSKFLKGEIV